MKAKIISIVDLLNEVDKKNEINIIQLDVQNDKVNDLYHEIEFNLHGINSMKLYKELKSVLRERRRIKGEMWAYSVLKEHGNILTNAKSRNRIKKRIVNNDPIYTNRIYSKNFEEIK